MVFDKMVANCLDFQWLGFQISDLIHIPDHAQPNLFTTIANPDLFRFQIPTVTSLSVVNCGTLRHWALRPTCPKSLDPQVKTLPRCVTMTVCSSPASMTAIESSLNFPSVSFWNKTTAILIKDYSGDLDTKLVWSTAIWITDYGWNLNTRLVWYSNGRKEVAC